MHPDLQRALDDISASIEGLSDAELRWHPPNKWSPAEILEHLMKAFSGTTYILTRAVEQGQSKARPDTWNQRFGAFVVVRIGYFPTGRQAPEPTRPSGLPPAEVTRQVRQALVNLDDAAARCAARFGERVKVANHPILGAFTLHQWRRFHRIHTRHHMKQIERIKSEMGQSSVVSLES